MAFGPPGLESWRGWRPVRLSRSSTSQLALTLVEGHWFLPYAVAFTYTCDGTVAVRSVYLTHSIGGITLGDAVSSLTLTATQSCQYTFVRGSGLIQVAGAATTFLATVGPIDWIVPPGASLTIGTVNAAGGDTVTGLTAVGLISPTDTGL